MTGRPSSVKMSWVNLHRWSRNQDAGDRLARHAVAHNAADAADHFMAVTDQSHPTRFSSRRRRRSRWGLSRRSHSLWLWKPVAMCLLRGRSSCCPAEPGGWHCCKSSSFDHDTVQLKGIESGAKHDDSGFLPAEQVCSRPVPGEKLTASQTVTSQDIWWKWSRNSLRHCGSPPLKYALRFSPPSELTRVNDLFGVAAGPLHRIPGLQCALFARTLFRRPPISGLSVLNLRIVLYPTVRNTTVARACSFELSASWRVI